MDALPIDPVLPEVCDVLRRVRRLVLVAPPGAGKTTRVPRALLDAGLTQGTIVVLEPRRIAARMSAVRVAEELGEEPGRTVGYVTRFDRKTSDATRVLFVTEGILARRLARDPLLRGVGAVLLDEFHERHLASDLACALLRRLTATDRPELLLAAMSATLDAEPLARYLDAPTVVSEGRGHAVDVSYEDRPDVRPLAARVASAVRSACAADPTGDVLVFLPGAREIQRAQQATLPLAHELGLDVLPLYGSLSAEEQDRAVRPSSRRKVILATNVAETSITIDGVTAVVDSGLARIASHAAWSGLPVLTTAKISKASAAQRAGRAGRTRPGRCLRLYTRTDHDARPAFELPEVQRQDLSEAVLELLGVGASPAALEWLDAPPARAMESALALLTRLGAIETHEALVTLTETGRSMLELPLHPRIARIVVEAARRGVAREGAKIAAHLSERTRRREGRATATAPSDVLAAIAGAPTPTARAVERQLSRQLGGAAGPRGKGSSMPPAAAPEARDDAAMRAILTGFPDRVGRLRRPRSHTGRRGREVVFAGGGMGVLSDDSVVDNVDLVVAVDVEEQKEGADRRVLVREASFVDVDWLLELYTEDVRDELVVEFDAKRGRIDAVRRLSYGALTLEETPEAHPDPDAIARALVDAARPLGLGAVMDVATLERLRARLRFARARRPNARLPELSDVELWELVRAHAGEARTLDALRQLDWASLVVVDMGRDAVRLLDDVAPERVRLHPGRSVPVEYPPDGAPFVASRLQDFFGLRAGPSVSAGEVPLALHLLAPNRRAVQVTTDLAGFWSRHYPGIAKELRRRYPKHPFPEDPATATPPPPGRPRR